MEEKMGYLNDIGTQFRTDKANIRGGHNYLDVYERLLSSFRDKKFTLIELGVGPSHNMGKSLLMWQKYFTKAQIVGVDIREDAVEVGGPRIKIELGDCGNPGFLSQLAHKYQPTVVIDDASHRWSHQITAFETVFPLIRSKGVFICEDLGTSFAPWTDRKAHVDHYEDAASYFNRFNLALLGEDRSHPSFAQSPPSVAQRTIAKSVEFTVVLPGSLIIQKK